MSTIAAADNVVAGIHARYMRNETLIAMLINSLFSAAFMFIVFGGREEIALWGANGVALDFVPQTFVITMMTVVVATLLTRKRVRSEAVPADAAAPSALPRNVVLRAGLLALIATAMFGGVATAILAIAWSGPYAFAPMLVFKIAYGAMVAAVMATIALRAALRDV
jgi:hypothetical protein